MTIEFITHQDWTAWLEPLTQAQPCGPDLEYDAQFRELEEAVSGRPEAEYGDTLVAAVPPDWEAADALGTALMARTRDLRVVMHMARARWVREGITGLADGLVLTAALLERHWEHVHPQLDASDGDDATARINALAAWTEAGGVLAGLMDSPLLQGRSPVTLREWSYANGETVAPEGHTMMSLTAIEASIAVSPDAARSAKKAFDAAHDSVRAIEATLAERVGAIQSLDFASLRALLERASSLLATGVGEHPDDAQMRYADEAGVASPAAANGNASSSTISSRADVAAALQRICAWYAQHEPASPVPLLLERARGLVEKSFVDLLKDLAPEGLAQLTQVVGTAAVETPVE
ncbi:type VI secretion system protein TssA [Paraburkholderia sp. CNPSo 3281]|uniref:type VI secretion system protein TssA n=1 Tax=Paraburkholderia sp. CNPSo 3281 TaxID=2940933 RepID=UPI0020B72A2F|nr:type VI secretion system protein TssA [Paraburkholderia sp. CNPSo 3281]MCP3718350.1 type VI secretion system protein TssA [Paraburkholderia sp. CNPSo 3281]